ncbi:hypothetical protein DMA11_06900 [Marinilabiliaceae bacterium JC017]|nr:hypothetical protein DMA11_06900 [Marinilabiliaceae bacterium JC017]
MKFTFLKIARHRTFHHDPIYYDEAKEERKARERRIKEELGLLTEDEKKEGYADRIKGQMRRRIAPKYEVTRSIKRRSNIRLIIILIALMILAYYLFQSGQKWLFEFLG